jgi:hypothetical protein
VTIYRLAVKDLSLIDSVSAPADSVSGVDFPDVQIPQAILQRTTTGYTFFVPTSAGTSSYQLDGQGDPVLGQRTSGEAGTQTDFDGLGRQVISILEGLPDVRGRQANWFGFGSSGMLYHESAIW